MFCVKDHQFDINPERASLSAFIGAEDGWLRTSWSLAISAIPRPIAFPALGDESPVELAPRIQLDSLPFAVTDWRRLAGTRHTLPSDINGWLLFSEWEPFTSLELEFGAVRDRSIVV